MHLPRLSVPVPVAHKLLVRHPLVRLPLQKRLPLRIQRVLYLMLRPGQCSPVQLAHRLLPELPRQTTLRTTLPTLLPQPCLLLLSLIL